MTSRSRVPVVLFERTVPLVVPAHWRQSAAYRRYRTNVDQATNYRAIIEQLEALLSDRSTRMSALLDFAPSADYARRLLYTTAVYRTRPVNTVPRELADRAVRLLIALLTGQPEHPGRKPNVPVSRAEAILICTVRGEWDLLVRPLWQAAGEDRRRFLRALETASSTRLPWAVPHRRELARLLQRPQVRPGTVIEQLTAWQLGIAVRRVRTARGRRPAAEVRYA